MRLAILLLASIALKTIAVPAGATEYKLPISDAIAVNVIHFDEIDSTQKYVRREKDTLLSVTTPIVAVSAGLQTAGIGHSGNWVSNFANKDILVTFLFKWPKEYASSLLCLPQVTAVSVAQTLEEFSITPQIKWVNDVMVGTRDLKKISGVLCENETLSDGDILCICGVGINVNRGAEGFETVTQPATSMKLIADKEFDKQQVFDTFITRLFQNIQRLQRTGFALFRDYITARLAYKDQPVVLTDHQTQQEITRGVLVGIDERFGALLIKTADGSVKQIISSAHLRLAD